MELFVGSDNKAATVSEVSVIRRNKKEFDAASLSVYLRSLYGYLQIERRITGSTGQLHLYPKDIGSVLVPMLSSNTQRYLADNIKNSTNLLMQSKSLYLQAEQMLLNEIGWDKLDLSQPRWWTTRFSKVTDIHRIDAEHFQPKYDKLLEHLKKTGKAELFGKIAPYIKRGLQPEYVENGDIIVVNSQHLGQYLVNVEGTERTDRNFLEKNKKARLRKNDILLYSTGAYVGRANAWLEDKEGIASNHVTIIRPNSSCDPLYLAVFLNSPFGLLQTDKWACGSSQREIYPDNIRLFWVYIPETRFQQQIAELVKESYATRKKAKALLEETKLRVEELVKRC